MTHQRMVLAATAVLAALLTTAACGSSEEPVKAEELAGSWRGSCGAQLDLAADGKLSGNSIPTFRIKDGKGVTGPVSGTGSWFIQEKGPGVSERRLEIRIGEGQTGENLKFKRDKEKLQLVLNTGDPDSSETCTFTK